MDASIGAGAGGGGGGGAGGVEVLLAGVVVDSGEGVGGWRDGNAEADSNVGADTD